MHLVSGVHGGVAKRIDTHGRGRVAGPVGALPDRGRKLAWCTRRRRASHGLRSVAALDVCKAEELAKTHDCAAPRHMRTAPTCATRQQAGGASARGWIHCRDTTDVPGRWDALDTRTSTRDVGARTPRAHEDPSDALIEQEAGRAGLFAPNKTRRRTTTGDDGATGHGVRCKNRQGVAF